jgi:2-polyprenyl-6-hydroxyphenyl methylase/3-demethylubiquinone-9 3-methyltransferase
MTVSFDFGRNWNEFASNALNGSDVEQARGNLRDLLAGIDIAGKSFLDIGFGQGLSLLIAEEAGGKVVGCDINPRCADALRKSAHFFDRHDRADVPIVIGSILDRGIVAALRSRPEASENGYDVVHSWGVLHHTGDMATALRNAGSLVRPGGHLVLAIYNRHWSSLPWKAIKWAYCRSPAFLQWILVKALYPVIWLAKALVTCREPTEKNRGMDFYYDVIDWVGGYPYEYASEQELVAFVEPLGYRCLRHIPAQVPTGCNEFIFQRNTDRIG